VHALSPLGFWRRQRAAKENVMVNDSTVQHPDDEMQRDAYNAAFHELGFRWHWDSDTYETLRRESADASQRIRRYLETRQPNLLKAYDVEFLVEVIQEKKAHHLSRVAASPANGARRFDWAQMLGCEVGF
jgi:hypothetical protein